MEKSEQIDALATSLVKFQSEMVTVAFDKDNPFFKSKYATLSSLVTNSKPHLKTNDLAVSQLLGGEGGVTTILMHKSGQYIMDTLTLKPGKDDPQGRGSAITYARRYAYAAILGLVSDEDDDGNAASKEAPVQKQQTRPAPKKTPVKDLTPAEAYPAAVTQIEGAKNSSELIILQKRISISKKFTDEQKEALNTSISAKVDKLDSGIDTIN